MGIDTTILPTEWNIRLPSYSDVDGVRVSGLSRAETTHRPAVVQAGPTGPGLGAPLRAIPICCFTYNSSPGRRASSRHDHQLITMNANDVIGGQFRRGARITALARVRVDRLIKKPEATLGLEVNGDLRDRVRTFSASHHEKSKRCGTAQLGAEGFIFIIGIGV